MLTVTETAKTLGISRSRVHILIREKRLEAQRFGRFFLLNPQSVKVFKPGPVGRPKIKERIGNEK
jgi:excisionase family DNA binding protein